MKALFYASNETGSAGRELQSLVEDLLGTEHVEVFRTVDNMARRLRRSRAGICTTVLLVAHREELERIIPIGHLFDDVGLLLVLPEDDPRLIAAGHALHPRFLTHVGNMGGDFRDVEAVLKKKLKAGARAA